MDGTKVSTTAMAATLHAHWQLYGHHAFIHALAVVLAGVATAWNSRENDFVWDDRAAVIGNRDVDTAASHWYECFANDFWGAPINTATSHKSYRPFTILSFRWDHFWHGFDSRAFHRTNVLIHAVCSLLVWRTACIVLYKYGRQAKTAEPQSPRWGALLAGLLFAVHPIHCDSVASIVGRADLLCVMFALSGFLSYSDAEKESSWHSFLVAIALGVCASLCKELGFTVFGIYVAYEVLCACAADRAMDLLTLSSPRSQRFAGLLVGGLVLFTVRLWVNGAHTTATFNILANSIGVEKSQKVRMLSYAHVHAWYLWKLLWPSWLSFDYGFNTIPVIYSVADPRNGLTMLAYAAVLVGVGKGVMDIKRSPLLLCITFGVIPFVPASNILFPVGTIVAERLLYFPSVGFSLIVGYMADQFNEAVDRLERQVKKTTPSASPRPLVPSSARGSVCVFACFILLAASYKSTIRNEEWKSEDILFTKAIEVVPENIKALNNAAKVLLNADPSSSFRVSRISVALLPKQVEGQSNFGLASSGKNTLLGIRHMLKAFAYGSTEASSAGYVGVHMYNYWRDQHGLERGQSAPELMMRSPTLKAATKFLEEAIRRGSRNPIHFFLRGMIAEQVGDYSSALRFFERAQDANERQARTSIDADLLISRGSVINMIAVVCRQLGDDERALSELLRGIDLYPTQEPSLYFNIASIYLRRGMMDWAGKYLDRCLKVCTDVGSIRGGAQLLERQGQQAAANLFYKRAAELETSSPSE